MFELGQAHNGPSKFVLLTKTSESGAMSLGDMDLVSECQSVEYDVYFVNCWLRSHKMLYNVRGHLGL